MVLAHPTCIATSFRKSIQLSRGEVWLEFLYMYDSTRPYRAGVADNTRTAKDIKYVAYRAFLGRMLQE